MRNFLLPLAALGAFAMSATPLLADPITYNVTYTIGAATATGTVVTDGTIGTLTFADLVSYDFTVTDGISSGILNNHSGGISFNGNALSATTSSLLFNFDAATGPFETFGSQDNSGKTALCYVGAVGYCNTANGDLYGSVDISVGNNTYSTGTFHGNTVIGTNAALAATPEPSSLILLGTGMIGMAGAFRRRFQA